MTLRPTDPDPADSERLAFAIVLFAALVALLPSIFSVFVWDDDLYITHNATLRMTGGFWKIWTDPYASPSPYPLVFATHWIEYQLWGDDPIGYKLVNVALHLANSLLLFALLRQLVPKAALLSASIFALHPIHVESIAQAAERKDVLSGLFYFLAFICWLKFTELDSTDTRKRWPIYVGTLLAFIAAMLSKTVTCTLPVTLLVITWWREPERLMRRSIQLIPLFAIGFVLGVYTIWWEKNRTGASGSHFDLSLIERTLIACRALWFYVFKILWPVNLMLLYPKWTINVTSIFAWLFPLGTAAVFAGLWLKQKDWGRAPLAAVLIYCVTLGPALGFVDYSTMFYSYVMDHYQYLAGAIIMIFMASAVMKWMPLEPLSEDLHKRRAARQWPILVGLLLLGVLTFNQGRHYKSVDRFWLHTVLRNPESFTAQFNYGLAIKNEGEVEASLVFLEHAIDLEPGLIDAWLHAGDALIELGREREGMDLLRESLGQTPVHAKAERTRGAVYNRMAVYQIEQRQFHEALENLLNAIRIDPQYYEAFNNLGALLEQAPELADEAGYSTEMAYNRALKLSPGFPPAHKNLGRIALANGDAPAAINHLQQALRGDPNNADTLAVLGNALFTAGNPADAIDAYHTALELDPDLKELHNNLGSAFAQTGRLSEAQIQFEKAVEANPNDQAAKDNLARVQSDLNSR